MSFEYDIMIIQKRLTFYCTTMYDLWHCGHWTFVNRLISFGRKCEVITIINRWLKFGRLKLPIGNFNFPNYDHRSRLANYSISRAMQSATRLHML